MRDARATASDAALLREGRRAGTRPVDGLTLHVVEAGPTDGPLLILLHGFPEFWWGWRHQITPLAARGYHVVAPDMRGYNRSDAPPEVAAYHLDTLAADVVMDAPHPDVWAREAIAHPTQALRSTYVALYQPPWLPEAALGAFDGAGLRGFMAATARADTFEPGALETYAAAWARPGRLTAMLNYYRALRDRERSDPPARVRRPTLVLWGEHDAFLERHVADASVAQCDDGHLVVVDGATHWLQLDEAERVTREIAAFCDGA